MAGTALRTQWRCLTPGCSESGEGLAPEADKVAERHGDKEGHATMTWSEPTLPIPVGRRH